MTRFKAKTCGKSSDEEPRARLAPYTPELHFPEGLGTSSLPGRPGSQLNPQPRSPGSRSASPGVGPGRVRSPGPSPSPRGRNLKLPLRQGGGGRRPVRASGPAFSYPGRAAAPVPDPRGAALWEGGRSCRDTNGPSPKLREPHLRTWWRPCHVGGPGARTSLLRGLGATRAGHRGAFAERPQRAAGLQCRP